MFEAVTQDIHIKVKPVYEQEQSSPDDAHFVWAYHIVIQNRGDKTVCLQDRHWVITDAHGHVQEVRGSGVIGQQPVLKPGESFAYTSGVNLRTPSGIMQGEYKMISDTGILFDVAIPAFSLDTPSDSKVIH